MNFAFLLVMKRVLLLGRDPIFAWALQKTICPLGCSIEHVYTLTEAKLRMNRFRYDVLMLDGRCEGEIELVSQQKDPNSAMVVFEDAGLLPDSRTRVQFKDGSRIYFLPKESELPHIVSSLREIL